MALSRRFSNIKPVGVSSSEAEDTEDDDDIRLRLFGKINRFKYSNPAKISFDCDRTDGSSSSNEDGDDDLLGDMEASWMEEFRDILNRCANEKEEPSHHTVLCEKTVQEIYHEPLDTLKNSLEKYNQHNHDETETQVVPELCEPDETTPYGDAKSVLTEDKFKETVEDVTVENVVKDTCSILAENDTIELDESLPASNKNHETLASGICDKKQDAGSCRKDNTERDKSIFTNKMHSSEKSEVSKPVYDKVQKPDSKHKNTLPITDKGETSTADSNKLSGSMSKKNHKKGNSVASDEHSNQKKSKDSKKVKAAHVNNKTSESDITDIKVCKEDIKSKDTKVSTDKVKDKHDSQKSKEKHAGQSVDALSKGDFKAVDTHKPNSACSVKEQIKSPTVQKEVKKPKTYNIKPASSFPLDLLLPMSSSSNSKPLSTSTKQTIPNTNDTINDKKEYNSKEIYIAEMCYEDNSWNSTYIQDSAPMQSWSSSSNTVQENVFHGTLYETQGPYMLKAQNPPYHDEEPYGHPSYQPSLPVSDTMPGQMTMSKFVSNNLSDIMMAIQNGNTSILTSLQEALYQEIGTNLQALAAKTKQQNCTEMRPNIPANVNNLGIYQQPIATNDLYCADQPYDRPTAAQQQQHQEESDQSEQLFHLFVQQCQGLVQTQEDKMKLETLIELLKTEAKGSLTSTGFTPPDTDKTQESESVLNINVANEEVLTDFSSSPKSITASVCGFFEGRTLLKGGVKPRHIPKTVTDKNSSQRPKDPRTRRYENLQVKLELPPFVKELWGQEKFDKIVALGEITDYVPMPKEGSKESMAKPKSELYYNPNEALLKTLEKANLNLKILQRSIEPIQDNKKVQINKSNLEETVKISSINAKTINVKTLSSEKVDKVVKLDTTLTKCLSSREIPKCENKANKDSVIYVKDSKSIKTLEKKKNESLKTLKTGPTEKSDNRLSDRKVDKVIRKPKESTPTGTDRQVISMDLDSDSDTNAADNYWKARAIETEAISSSDADDYLKPTAIVKNATFFPYAADDNWKDRAVVTDSALSEAADNYWKEKAVVTDSTPSNATENYLREIPIIKDSTPTYVADDYWKGRAIVKDPTPSNAAENYLRESGIIIESPQSDSADNYLKERAAAVTDSKSLIHTSSHYEKHGRGLEREVTNNVESMNKEYKNRHSSDNPSDKAKYRNYRTNKRDHLDVSPVTDFTRSDIAASRKYEKSSYSQQHHYRSTERSTSSSRHTSSSSHHKSAYLPTDSTKPRGRSERGSSIRSDRESSRDRSSRRDIESRERKRHNTVQESHTSECKKRRYEDNAEENRRRSHGDTRRAEIYSGHDRSVVDSDKVVTAYEYHRQLQPGYSQQPGYQQGYPIRYPDYCSADDRRKLENASTMSLSERYRQDNFLTPIDRQSERSPVIVDARSKISFKINQNKDKKSPIINKITYESSPKSYSPQYGTKTLKKDNKTGASSKGSKDLKVTVTKKSDNRKIVDKNNKSLRKDHVYGKEKTKTPQAQQSDSFSYFKPAVKKVSPVLKAEKTLEEDRKFLLNLKKRLSGEMEPVKQEASDA